MLKALADLPGERGLEAVDRFSSSSLETVRSKTGFMVRAPITRPYTLQGSDRVQWVTPDLGKIGRAHV